MMKTMRAALFDESTEQVSVQNISIPAIATDEEMLVKIASASLCHSDLMLLDGTFPGPGRPVVLGHEGVGFVEKTGSGVTGFKKGDIVGFLYIDGACFKCEGCQIHNLNCEKGNSKLHGFGRDGFFAEYATVDYRNAIILPPSLDIKTSAPIFCAGVTAHHAIDECDLEKDSWVGVIGCGGLGLLGIQYAKAMGLKVVGIDINDDILAGASKAGADYVFNSMTNAKYADELKKVTVGGVHAAVVFAGSGPAYNGAPSIVRMNGLIMAIGLMNKPIEINSIAFMRGLFRIKSTATGPPHKLRKAIEFTAKHNICSDVSFYELDDIQKMIDTMKSGKSKGRMLVAFDR